MKHSATGRTLNRTDLKGKIKNLIQSFNGLALQKMDHSPMCHMQYGFDYKRMNLNVVKHYDWG
jgi:hypothetical protein